MKYYNKQPTLENIIQSIIDNNFGRNKTVMKFVQRINQILSCDEIENSFSISLDSDWGAGKTFFVKQVILALILKSNCIDTKFYSHLKIDEETKNKLLDSLNQAEQAVSLNDQGILTTQEKLTLPVIPIYYDAWKYDNTNEPVLSLINEMVNSINSLKGLHGKSDVKEGLSGILSGLLRTVNMSYTINNNIAVGIDGNGLADSLSAFKNFERPDYLSMFSEEDEIHTAIKKLFEKLMGKEKNKLVIFIDELDRCKPSYAVTLLERIKHFFDNENIIFVFSTNLKQLSNTVKNAYGMYFDSDRYLDRFFDIKFNLPEINVVSYLNYLECNPQNMDLTIILSLFQHFKLTIREINFFWTNYNLSRPLAYKLNQSDPYGLSKKNTYSITRFLIPLITIIKICRCSDYESFINGNKTDLFIDPLEKFQKDLETYFDIDFDDPKADITPEKENIRTFLSQLYYAIFAKEKCNEKLIKTYNLTSFYNNRQNIISVLLECTSLISENNAIDL